MFSLANANSLFINVEFLFCVNALLPDQFFILLDNSCSGAVYSKFSFWTLLTIGFCVIVHKSNKPKEKTEQIDFATYIKMTDDFSERLAKSNRCLTIDRYKFFPCDYSSVQFTCNQYSI